MEGKSEVTLEYSILPEKGVKFHSIITGRLQRKLSFWTFPALLKIPVGFIQSFFLLIKIKPKVILSFGGFAAFPVVFSGWLLSIPIVIHEQTAAVGRSNKFSSFFARKVAVARETSLKYFPQNKTEVIGNPISEEFFQLREKKRERKPTIFIMGGSRGSMVVNDLIEPILESLLKKYIVVHQAGEFQKSKFKKLKENLKKNNYQVFGSINSTKMPNFYKVADLIISRAGANTVSEIIASKRTAILIPIPWSYENEQTKNAIFAKKYAEVKILNQESLTSKKLGEVIDKVLENKEDFSKFYPGENPDKNAAKKLVNMIEVFVK